MGRRRDNKRREQKITLRENPERCTGGARASIRDSRPSSKRIDRSREEIGKTTMEWEKR